MIVSRTPFRISLFGGGTDYPAWFQDQGGLVVSTTINKYCYLFCRAYPPFFHDSMRLVWSKIELTSAVDQIEHPAIRAVLQYLGIEGGVEIHHAADLPARSGLGASSSFTVGLLQALHRLRGEAVEREELARQAIHVEQVLMQDHVGLQDQIAAAFGGFNRITFRQDGAFLVEPLDIEETATIDFERHLLLFFTGISRSASEVARAQIQNIPERIHELSAIQRMASEGLEMLLGHDWRNLGLLLNESWRCKRALSTRISSPYIDEIYEAGIGAGAWGGKLLGAGGGGFVLLCAPPVRHAAIRERLRHLLHVPFRFERQGGATIIYADGERMPARAAAQVAGRLG